MVRERGTRYAPVLALCDADAGASAYSHRQTMLDKVRERFSPFAIERP